MTLLMKLYPAGYGDRKPSGRRINARVSGITVYQFGLLFNEILSQLLLLSLYVYYYFAPVTHKIQLKNVIFRVYTLLF